jgi:hypothetical protein
MKKATLGITISMLVLRCCETLVIKLGEFQEKLFDSLLEAKLIMHYSFMAPGCSKIYPGETIYNKNV